MSFKLFAETYKKRTSMPTITIMATGNLYMNLFCVKKYIKERKYINLLFDIKKKIIGIKPIKSADAHSYSVRTLKVGALICVRSFLKYYDIDLKRNSQRYLVTWNEKEKLIEIKI